MISGGKVASCRIAENSPLLPKHVSDYDEDTAKKTVTAGLAATIDGFEVTALVDTGADFSITSEGLADELKKVGM